MKTRKLIRIILTTGIFIISQNLYSQETCKVLIKELEGRYSGKCKKGLAHGKGKAVGEDRYEGVFSKGYPHGKGTYTWANGDIYTGEWKKGKRQGDGILKCNINGKDTVMDGLWKEDKYMGPKPIAPKVIVIRNIERHSIIKYGGDKDRVLISFMQNGMRNSNISNVMMTANAGLETKIGYMIGYENIEFPIRIKLNYTTWNKILSIQYDAMFEFEISEPGDWRVEVNN